MNGRRVAVIGGGLAGLSAAARIREFGATPYVFEQADEVGGVVRTIERDGWLIDAGAALAAEPDPRVRAMLDTAGVDAFTVRAHPAAANRYIVLNGAPVALPRTTSEFTSSPLLSIGGRLRLLKERFIPAVQDASEETVSQFARRRFGDEMAERMFDPLIASTCGGNPDRVLARHAFPTLVGHERGSGSGLQGSARAGMTARRRAKGRPTGSWGCQAGMQQLPRRLAAAVGRVRTGAKVDRVMRTGAGIAVHVAGSAEEFDAVVFALPTPSFGAMQLDIAAAHEIAALESIPLVSVAAVSLGFHRSQVRFDVAGSRLLVPTAERRRILSMVFPSIAFDGRAPAEHLLITTYIGGERFADVAGASDGQLQDVVMSELVDLLGVTGSPVVTDVSRWMNALPQAVAGHRARLQAVDRIEQANSDIVFTGGWRDGLSIGEVLLGGMEAADRLTSRLAWVPSPQ